MADISNDTVSASGGYARAVQSKIYEYVSVIDFVSPTDPANNFTNAFRRALATGKNVFVPPLPQGYYFISDYLTISTPGQVIFGQTGGSRISVDGSFNMNAPGVIKIDPACSERNSGIDGIEICFSQPANVTQRSDLIRYPYAIYAPDVTRMKFGHLKISNAWNGMYLNGNTGGLIADVIEIGSYNLGILCGGALDWWNINTLTFWPYAIANFNIYADPLNVAARFGRVDGLNIKALNCLSTQIIIESTGSATGFGTINTLSLDANGRIDFIAGNYNIGSWYATSSIDRYSINVAGAAVTFGPGRLLQFSGATKNPSILVASGTANFGPMICDSASSHTYVIAQTGGSLLLDAPVFTANNGNRAQPYIACLGGRMSLRHPKFADVGTSTGNAVSIASDDWHDIVINQTIGWPIALPATRAFGTYVIRGVKQ